jgi:hypothetical protein
LSFRLARNPSLEGLPTSGSDGFEEIAYAINYAGIDILKTVVALLSVFVLLKLQLCGRIAENCIRAAFAALEGVEKT